MANSRESVKGISTPLRGEEGNTGEFLNSGELIVSKGTRRGEGWSVGECLHIAANAVVGTVAGERWGRWEVEGGRGGASSPVQPQPVACQTRETHQAQSHTHSDYSNRKWG